MKGIEQIIKDGGEKYGLQPSEDYVKYIVEEVNREYKTVNEVAKKDERIKGLQEQVAALGEKVKAGEDDAKTIEDLKAQVEGFAKAEKEREEREAVDKARKSFEDEFKAAVGEKRFANSYTEQHVFAKAFELRMANPDMKAGDILDGLVKDQDGVWANERGHVSMSDPSDKNADAALGDFATALFHKG